jgi:hypothetical protein
MTGAHDLFLIFTMSYSSMYEELSRRTRHVLQGYGVVVFHMKSRGLLRVENVIYVPGVHS